MSELERALRELTVGFPETPELATPVRSRIEAAPARRPARRVRPALVVAFVLLLCGGALAASPLGDDILDWLGIGGVEVRRAPELPPAPSSSLDLGKRVTLAEARRSVEAPVAVPSTLGEPDGVYLRGERLALVYRPRRGLPEAGQTALGAIVAQLPGTASETYIQKTLGPGTEIRPVQVNGVRGFFIEGRPHAFVYADENGVIREEATRLATNTLLWERDGITHRIEAEIPLEQAVRIAEGLRDEPRP